MLMKLKSINAFKSNLRIKISLSFRIYYYYYSTTTTAVTQLLNLKSASAEPLTKTQLKALVLRQYSRGYFSNLLQSVVALPSVLLAASLNLFNIHHLNAGRHHSALDAVSNHFSVQEMGRALIENRFDIQSCCVKMSSSSDNRGIDHSSNSTSTPSASMRSVSTPPAPRHLPPHSHCRMTLQPLLCLSSTPALSRDPNSTTVQSAFTPPLLRDTTTIIVPQLHSTTVARPQLHTTGSASTQSGSFS